jgi:hypothetical protein
MLLGMYLFGPARSFLGEDARGLRPLRSQAHAGTFTQERETNDVFALAPSGATLYVARIQQEISRQRSVR